MIADRYRERRFREGFIVGFKEGRVEGYDEGRAEQCRRLRQILDPPPTERTPEMRDGLLRALAELESAPIPAYNGHGCCRPGI